MLHYSAFVNGTNLVSYMMVYRISQYQATKKHSLAWQDSLRYRVPDLDKMSGLRRITVCKNTLLGDKGVEALAEALKDDLWLKGKYTPYLANPCNSEIKKEFFINTQSIDVRNI